MLVTDLSIPRHHRPFGVGPVAFNALDMDSLSGHKALPVVYSRVPVSKRLQLPVDVQAIRVHATTPPDVHSDQFAHSLRVQGRDHDRVHSAAALPDPDDGGFAGRATPAFSLSASTIVRIVDLHLPAQTPHQRVYADGLANAIQHRPGRLVGHAQLGLQGSGRDADLEQPDRQHPLGQWGAGLREDHAAGLGEVMAAPAAAVLKPSSFPHAPNPTVGAVRTTDTSRPPDPAKQADASLLARDDGPIFVQPNRAKTLVCHALEATMRTL